jgi:hypothetical protein
MTEFDKLSADEIRVLREHRAQKAMATRPPDTREVILRLMRIIRDASLAGRAIDPNDPLWEKICELVPIVNLD